MNISVIMPVYNAANYLDKAVKSVLLHNEVKELIIVNDGSIDNSSQILKRLQKEDNRIKIYHHKNKINKGRSASRNLALQNVTQPFIAFLDADDFYLENRFEADKQLFESDDSIDGVYNAIGAYFYRESSERETLELGLTTIREPIEPDELFECLLNGKKGYFSIDGLTIKREVLLKINFFKEHLVVAEDTDWLLKMSLVSKLVAGNIKEAVAMRGVHDTNVFNKEGQYKVHRQKMFESVLIWCFKNKVKISKIDILLNRMFYYRYKENYSLNKELKYWLFLLKSTPKLMTTILGIKYCPIIRKRKQLFPFLFR
ncbi:glycosyltransferase family 2 protein [Flavobacterium sediminilitoris]|uniref:Glycosyltransferase family 2 protein n=1 Tax=Flavobacterium sediminilitoris TaxID=2024526 RepID=A0ABY4HRA0_9FLAO|nr:MULTISPECIES: glycosyltransferase family A protein [Flavobacterium]UOX34029.1 glycosyltransferase family 2 protein [Flavobacterium sediminilitoris]